jgi:hypothetical protein
MTLGFLGQEAARGKQLLVRHVQPCFHAAT